MITLDIPKLLQKKINFFFIQYKDEWKQRQFWRQKSQKSGFYKSGKEIKMDEIDVNKILVFKEEPYGKKMLYQM